MKDLVSLMNALKRPRLLVRAARIGADEYRRERHLQRLLGYGTLPRSGPALMQLLDVEQSLEDQRQAGDAGYSLTRHLDVLIAMMGESRLLRAQQAGQESALT